jgi:hypothetical protein
MKRVSIAVMALVACLAIVAVPAATAKKKKVKKFPTTISLAVSVSSSSDPYAPAAGTASGRVASARGPQACRAGRTVSILRNGAPTGLTVITQTDGSYSLTFPSKPAAGSYTASVPKVVIKKTNKKTGVVKKKKCLAATSNTVTVS